MLKATFVKSSEETTLKSVNIADFISSNNITSMSNVILSKENKYPMIVFGNKDGESMGIIFSKKGAETVSAGQGISRSWTIVEDGAGKLKISTGATSGVAFVD